MDLPFIAGTISTVIFATSMLPMLIKARRTRDLTSYSLGNIVLSNLGNLVHSLYVFSLPAGPVWALHGFYLVSMGLLLLWYLRFNRHTGSAGRVGACGLDERGSAGAAPAVSDAVGGRVAGMQRSRKLSRVCLGVPEAHPCVCACPPL
jgi:uncharacterized protein with PQ loop repeat